MHRNPTNVESVRSSLALALAFAVSACVASSDPRPSVRAALDAHLATIATRDLGSFAATLTAGEDLLVIFPDGSVLPDKGAVLDFHQRWFSDEAWIWTPEIVKIIEGTDQASALLRYEYRDSAGGSPRAAWLVLVFALEADGWRLVHDQNTRIESPGD